MGEIVQMIATYGIIPVLLGVLLFLLIRMSKKQQEMNKKQQDDNSALEKRLMETFQQMLKYQVDINHNTNPIHTKEEENDNRRVNLLVSSQLVHLLKIGGANRTTCFLYHNGGRDAIGRSFQKMSMTHEIVDPNTVPVMTSYQSVPRMLFPILNQKMVDQGYYFIDDIEQIRDIDATTYQAFKSRGTKAVYLRSIRTTDHVELGFLGVEYSVNTCSDVDKLKRHLLNAAIKVSGALEVGTDDAAVLVEDDSKK